MEQIIGLTCIMLLGILIAIILFRLHLKKSNDLLPTVITSGNIATLNFNLDDPDGTTVFKCAIHGNDLALIIWELDQWLRSETKYNNMNSDIEIEAYDKIRDKIRELLNDRGLTFEHQIFV